ncbi:MAG: hypothetical protein RBT35_03665 [Bacteroidales bacterium]|jgi:hypothetical protein|nr:hypothetical protein [Bacteroidales bacterium]
MAKYGWAIWSLLLAAIATFLAIPQTREIFEGATASHPYIMGFIKFSILSTMGEFLAVRLVKGEWQAVKGMFAKMVVWGVLGMMIVAMFSLFTAGVAGAAAKGLLWTGGSKLLFAFFVSFIMNYTFGAVFMAAHRITDSLIENGGGVSATITNIDWSGFIKFVVGKTIPFFWVPAHTITFLLPDQYRVLFAASLSIVLGLILSYAKLRK